MKRLVDVCGAGLGLVLLCPLFALIAVLIKLSDEGAVFFLQERVGVGGTPFRMWKFRTMVVDAEKKGRQVTIGRDPRVTRVGQCLRKLKLDELPQLLNVLSGEMSLVGPRPEVPKYVALYSEEQRQVLEFKPGITDPASIEYRDEADLLAESPDPEHTYVEEIMPEKIRINLEYARSATIWSDCFIVFKTLLALFHQTPRRDSNLLSV